MRVIVLTYRRRRGVDIVGALRRHDVPVTAIVLDAGHLGVAVLVRKLRRTLRRRGRRGTARAVVRRGRDVLSRNLATRPTVDDFRPLCDTVHVVRDVNARRGRRLLERLRPDLVVLGPSRILRPGVIAIPRLGTLNAHPGLLPDYRGVDVIPWALHNGDPLGVTVHLVDAGVDTGPIVASAPLPVRPGDTLASLKRRAHLLGADLLGQVVARVLEEGFVRATPQPADHGQQYFRMPPDLLADAEHQLFSRET